MPTKFKRFIALIAIVLGFCFTLLALLSIWQVPGFSMQDQLTQKLIPSLGVLTLAFVILLAIIRMTEERK